MKSLNNLLLLGDGETWSRQKIDFSGLPEMVRTFLQVAAGAADIPVTRLLGQSPAGMSATGENDTRNYYDMIAARQAIDLKPQLERLDALILRSAGVDPAALSFEFRPLWQMDAAVSATIALQKAQATQIYAGLNLWPAAVTAKLVEAQLAEDGTYPGAEGIFAEATPASQPTADFDPAQPRDPDGRWSKGGCGPRAPDGSAIILAGHHEEEEEATGGLPPESVEEPDAPALKIVSSLLRKFPGSSAPPVVIPPFVAEPITPLADPASRIMLSPTIPSLAAPVPPPLTPSVSQTPGDRIRFRSNPNQDYHAYRHIEENGLDRGSITEAIREDLSSRIDILPNGLYQGSVLVDGQKVGYNAYKLPDGVINVGRITLPR